MRLLAVVHLGWVGLDWAGLLALAAIMSAWVWLCLVAPGALDWVWMRRVFVFLVWVCLLLYLTGLGWIAFPGAGLCLV